MRYILLLTVLFGVGGCTHSPKNAVVALQPLGELTTAQCRAVAWGVDSVYGIQLKILPAAQPPKSAFTNVKVPRYRADKLLPWLIQNKPDTIDYVIGLADFDISTTKVDMWGRTLEPASSYDDWGIFGLGTMPGKSCIISLYRISGCAPTALKMRLAKIAVHEFGHNLGLNHCANKKCVMTDAVERISTIDNADLQLCAECRKKISR